MRLKRLFEVYTFLGWFKSLAALQTTGFVARGVRIEDNTLAVHGERNMEKEEKRRTSVASSGATKVLVRLRSYMLPSSVDRGQMSVDYARGVLKIKLIKNAETKPKQIKVNVGGKAVGS